MMTDQPTLTPQQVADYKAKGYTVVPSALRPELLQRLRAVTDELVAGASKGEGLGNKFLAHIREVDAIAHVVRCFENTDIIHVAGRIDPIDDIEIIDTELALADLDSVEKALNRAEKAEATRARLFDAAVQIVGEYGYAGTSVARITERAAVASIEKSCPHHGMFRSPSM